MIHAFIDAIIKKSRAYKELSGDYNQLERQKEEYVSILEVSGKKESALKASIFSKENQISEIKDQLMETLLRSANLTQKLTSETKTRKKEKENYDLDLAQRQALIQVQGDEIKTARNYLLNSIVEKVRTSALIKDLSKKMFSLEKQIADPSLIASHPQYIKLEELYSQQFDRNLKLEETIEDLGSTNSSLQQRIMDSSLMKSLADVKISLHSLEDCMIIDKKGIIVDIKEGPRLKELGYSSQDLLGKNYSAIICTTDAARFEKAFKETKFNPEYLGFRLGVGLKRNDGLLLHYNLKTKAIRDAEGEFAYYLLLEINKETHDYHVNKKSEIIKIPKRLSRQVIRETLEKIAVAKEEAKKGKEYLIDMTHSNRLGKKLITLGVGPLLAIGANIQAIGVKNLNPPEYTLLRDPSLGIEPKRLGIMDTVYISAKGKYQMMQTSQVKA